MRKFLKGAFAASTVIAAAILLLNCSALFGQSGTWSQTGNLTSPRTGAAAVLLKNGEILITGGSDANGVPQASAEFYNPSTGAFSAAPAMNVPRANHAAIILSTDDVLVTGGITDSGGDYTSSSEIFSAAAQQWTQLQASLPQGLAGHAMAALSDGNILIAGGQSTTGPVGSLLLFNLSNDSITPIGQLLTARTSAVAAATPDGRVLIAGGTDINNNVLASTEIFTYDPVTLTGTVTAGPNMSYARTSATATSTYDGVAIIGGYNVTVTNNQSVQTDLGTAEIFSQWTNTFKVVNGGTPRSGHFAVMLPNNGAILAMGGTGGTAVDLLQPWANSMVGAFIAGAPSLSNQAGGFASPASLGSLLAAGGLGASASVAELYWFPTIATDQPEYAPGTTVVMTGTGFQPGETVDLHMHIWVNQTTTDLPEYTVPADGNGNISFSGYAPNPSDIGANYHLTAVGESSGFQAQTTFGDASPTTTVTIVGSGSVNVARSSGSETISSCTGACAGFTAGSTQYTCSATCTLAWNANYNATLTATPNTGNAFAGWSGTGGCTGTSTCAASANGSGGFAATATFAGPATKLVYTTVPSTGTAGTAFSVTVQSQDANGTPSSPTSNTTITLSKASGGGTLSGTLTGTILTSGNSVTISTPVYSKADTMTLTATATAGETTLTPVTSGNIVFSAGAATQLVFTTTPVTVTAGVVSSTITVQREDQYGNPNTADATRTVTLSSNSTGTVTFTPTSLSIASGASSASFTYTDTKAGTPTITAASASPSTITSATQQETVNPAAASKLVFTTTAVTVTAGVASSTITVQRQDQFGNPNTTDAIRTVTLSSTSGASATFTPASPLSIPNGSSSASFTYTDTKAGTPTITAASTSPTTITSATQQETVIAATADKLAFLQQPSTTTAGNAISPSVTVQIQDQYGNLTSSTASIAMAIGTNPSSGTLSGTTPVSAVNGVATFSNLSINNVGNSYTLQATSGSLTLATSSAFNITARAITVTAATNTKTYDGTTSAAATPTITSGTLAPGDTANFTEAYANKNVGTSLTLTPSGTITNGANNVTANYNITFVNNTAGVINKLAITVTAATNTKTYDGTTSAAVTPTVTSGAVQTGDTANFTEVYNNKNAGTGKTLTPSGTVTDGNGGANYTYTFVTNTTGTINAEALTVTAATNSKGYDGTTSAAATPTITSGAVQTGDTANFTQAYSSKNVGTGLTLTPSGTVSDGNSGNNYTYTFVTNTTGIITARAITVTAATNSKTYDGTTAAAVTPTITSGSLATGDTASFTEAYSTKNAGTSLTLTPSGSVSDGNSGNNYAVTFANNTTGVITARSITVTAATNSKTYDGTTSAAATPTITSGTVQIGDTANFTESYSNKNAGVGNKTLIPAGTVSDGNGGNNYAVTFVNFTTGTINAQALTVTATTNTKTYDGTTSAAATPTITSGAVQTGDTANFTESYSNKNAGVGNKTLIPAGTVSDGNSGNNYTYTFLNFTTGTINAEALTVTAAANSKGYDGTTSAAATPAVTSGAVQIGDTANFIEAYSSKNVGTRLTLTPSGTVTDGNSGNNYTVTFVTNTTGIITARAITVTAATNSKTYDGTTSAAATPTITSGGLATGDTASFTEAYSSKNVGTGLTLTPSGFVNDGNSGNNYAVTFANNTTGAITARSITVTAATNSKTYDGTTAAAATPTITSGTLATGDTASFTEAYSNKNAGTGKTLTPSGSVSDGVSGNNYAVTFVNNTTGVITAEALTVTAATNTKIYDGTASAEAIPTITSGTVQTGDTANFTEVYSNKNAGTGKTLTPSGTISDGNSGNNYTYTFVTNTTGVITAEALTVTAATNSKGYDGSASAAATPMITSGTLQGTDTANFTEAYASKNVGTGLTMTPSGTVSDGNSGNNYTYTFVANTTGVITARAITVMAATNSKTYDGTTAAAVTPTITSGSLATGDTASFTEAYSSKNVGTGLTLTPSGTVSDGNGGNNYTYTFVNNTSGVITVKTLTVSGITANNKTYDTTTAAALNTGSAALVGVVTGDNVTLNTGAATGTFASANVGTGITVTISGLTVTGTDAGNYSLTQPTTTANITQATPTVTVTGGTFTYNGNAQAATATATGVGGATVSGTFSFTYTPPGNSTAPTNAGTYSVSASFTSTNSNYGNATGSGSITISKATATFSTPLTSPAVIAYGTASVSLPPNSPMILAAGMRVGSPDTVTITINGVSSSPIPFNGASGTFGPISFPTSTIPAGSYPITYTYSGNANVNSLTDTSTTQTVNKVTPTFTNLTASQSISYGTASITLSGRLTGSPANPPSGSTVTISINGVPTTTTTTDAAGDFSTSVTTSALNASATPYTITYSYAASTDFNVASNTSTALTVNTAATTTSISSAPTVVSPANGVVMVTVSSGAGTPTGNATLVVDGGSPLSAPLNSSGVATFTLTSPSPGPHSLSASYAAQGNFSASGPTTGTLTVDLAPSITSGASTTFTAGTAGTFTVTTMAFPTPALGFTNGSLPSGISFTDNGNGTATIAGTATVAGSYPITITASNGVGTAAMQMFTLVVSPGSFTQLQILVPGETAAPGTTSGYTGSPNIQYVNGAFNATVNATDQYWNVVSTVTDAVAISSSDTKATFSPASAALVNGTGSFTVTLETVSYNPSATTVTASDTTNTSITSATSPAIEVIVVYTAAITPTMAGTGDATTYTLTIINAAAPNTNSLASAEIAVPSADRGTISNVSVAATGANWSYDPSQLPATMRFAENTSNDVVAPGGTITITFTSTSSATVSSAPVPEVWDTTAFSDAASTNALPLAWTDPAKPGSEPTVNIGAAPQITSANNTSAFTYGTSGTTFTVTTTGVPTPSLAQSGSFPSWATFTDNGNGTATISGTPTSAGTSTFTITAHNGFGPDSTQSFTLTVNKANANITVTPYNVTYDATAHTAIGTATGVGSVDLSSDLNLSGTTHTNAGTHISDNWTFTDPSGNYNNASGTVTDVINQATATITVTPYHVTYDGNPHTAMGTSTGVGGVNLSSDLKLTNTTHTNAGTYSTDIWTFTDPTGNYKNVAATTIIDQIDKANATVVVTPYTVTYDGNPHSATITSITGVNGEMGATVGAVTLNTTHTNAATYSSDSWSFTGAANYNDISATTITDTINKATAVVVVTPYTVTYDGNPHSATITSITGVNGEMGATVGTVTLNTTHTNAATYSSDSWSFTGAANYNDISATTITDTINKATAVVVVAPYTVTYDGNPHTATVTSITGVNGESGATVGTVTLNTTHTNAGVYSSDSWSFTGAANYNDISATTITDTINKANATVVVTPYAVTYDGNPHTATITSITGVNGETGATVGTVTLNTTHTNAGVYSSDSWSFTGAANYNNISATSITDTINPAATTTSLSALTVISPANGVVMVTVNSGAGTPTGNATLVVDGGSPLFAPLSGSETATFTLTSPSAGIHTLSASYAAQGNYAASGPTVGTLTVDLAPSITSGASTTFTAGVAGTFTVTSMAFPAAALSESGTLPSGVTFTDNRNGTAMLAGTALVAGSYPITITANNGVVGPAMQAFTLIVSPGSFTQLQILVPGETAAPGTTTGYTGSPSIEYVNGPFNVTVNAVDPYFNVVSSVTDTVAIAISSNDPTATASPLSAALVAGTGTFSVTPEAVSNPAATTVTASDTTTASISSVTSPAIEVIVVYTASIAPANWATGQQGSYTLIVSNAPAPNMNNLESIEIAVPAADQGTISNVAMSPATWTYDASKLPGIMRFVANSAGDAVSPGSAITVTFNATSSQTVSSSPVAEVWNTTAYSDIASTNALPLAPPEPTVELGAAPQITSASNTSAFTYGTAGTTFTVTTTGVPTPSLSAGSGFPAWATFTDNHDGTATISGTPTAAGPSTFTITAHNGYGNDATQGFTLTVQQATATINVTPYTVTYDGNQHTATATATGVGGANLIADLNLSGTAHTNAGTYATDAWSFHDPGGNYADASGTVSDTINKATATVVVAPYTVTYDGNPHTATVTSITGVNGEMSATVGTVTLNTTHTNAGVYSIDSWSFTGAANYNDISATTITDTISKANATVVVTPYTVTYDGNPHTATVTSITGVNGEMGATVGAVTLNTTHTNAATYSSDSWSFTGAANYNDISATTITDTINKATAVVVVAPYSVTYDANPHTATVTSITGVNGETGATVGTVTLNTTHTNAGVYSIDSWSFTGAANYNNIASTTVTDTISQAALTVTASSPTVIYGSPIPVITPGFSAFQGSDTYLTALSTQPTCGTAYTPLSPAGSSPATSCMDAVAANYAISYIGGTITISPAAPVLPGPVTGSSTYGTSVTLTVTVSSPDGGETPTGTVQFQFVNPVNSMNYNICSDGSLQVQTPPPGTPCTVPLNSGTATVTTTNLPAGMTADAIKATYYPGDGNYLNENTSINYIVSQASTQATLSIMPATTPTYGDTVTLSSVVSDASTGSTGTPTGTVQFEYSTDGGTTWINIGSPASLIPNADPTTGATATTATTTLPAGTPGIKAVYSGDSNFSGVSSGTASYAISQKTLTVSGITANDKPYDGSTTATLNTTSEALVGVISPDVVTLTGTATGAFTDANAGSGKTVNITGLSLTGAQSSNYSLTEPTATASITKVQLTVTAPSLPVTYGDPVPASLTPMIAGFVNGEGTGALSTQPTCTTTYTQGSNAGSAQTTICSGGMATNYSFTYVSGTVTVNKATATVVVTPYSVTYDGNPHSATITSITGVNGEMGATVGTVTLNTTHTNAATYSTDTWSFTGAANYNNIAATTITDTINKATATVVVAPYSVTYDGNPHTATVTSITGVNGEMGATVGAVTLNTTHTNAATYSSDSWSFTGAANYNDISATTITDTISKANAIISVTSYSVTYDGNPHTATVTSITGVNGEMGATVGTVMLNTTHTNAATYSTDSWSFTGAANYNDISATTITDTINKANATVVVTPYTVTYDGNPHTATVTSITGVNGESGATVGAVTLNSTHTNAATYPSDSWSFTGAANYNNIATTTITDTINKATAVVVVTPYAVTYDGNPHTATITSINGVNGEMRATVGTVTLNTTHTNAATYSTDTWSFTGVANYNNIAATTITDTINQAPLAITASSGSMIYGGPVFPVTASYSGFAIGQSAASLTAAPTCSTTATSGSPVSGNPYLSSCSGAMDSNYSISYISGTVIVTQASTISAVTSSVNPSTFMQSVTFTATVTPQYSGTTPTGTVTFYNNGSQIGAGSLSALCGTPPCPDQATFSTSSLPDSGPDSITAVYGGDGNFTGSQTSGTNGNGSAIAQSVSPAPNVSLSPLSVSFGNQNVNTTSSPTTVTLKNIGDATLNISTSGISIYPSADTQFAQTNNCGTSLVAGNSCTITIKFTPVDTGIQTASLQITDNDDDTPGAQQIVSLTGAGLSTITGSSLYTDAVFATASGCGSITGSGNSSIDSFNSTLGYSSSHTLSGGNVGSNGNVTLSGNSTIYGSVAVDSMTAGNCSKTSLTGLTTNGNAKVTGGHVALNGPITYPAPPAPNPVPPTTNQNVSHSCPSGMTGCTNGTNNGVTLAPGSYGNVQLSGGTTAYLSAGNYNFNSLTLSGNSILYVNSGPVTVNLAGTSLSGGNPAMDLTGGSIVNPTGNPANLQFTYAGTQGVNLSGGSQSSSTVYAPNAMVNMSGNADFFGSIIGSTITNSGNAAIHYDANLANIKAGNYIWFNAVVNNLKNLGTGQVKLYLTNSTISFTANGIPYSVPVPNAVITFNSTSQSSGAKTIYDTANNRWSTAVSPSGLTGNTFVTGVAFQVPSNFPTGIQNVSWSAAFTTDAPGVSLQWQWGAAVYPSSFGTTYATTGNSNVLGVNAEDGTGDANGTDPAGTPEAYKASVIFGATGGGLTNYTGYYSLAAGVVPTIAPMSVSPSSLDFAAQNQGTTSATMTSVLTNNDVVSHSISSITIAGSNASNFTPTNNCPISPNTLAAGASCTITVTFTPSDVGTRTAKVVVNDDANNSPQTVYLSGTGQ